MLYAEAAYRNDGRLLALRTKNYTNQGTYYFGCTHGVVETLTPSGAAGAYTVEHLNWEVLGVYTNKMAWAPTGATVSTPPPMPRSELWTVSPGHWKWTRRRYDDAT